MSKKYVIWQPNTMFGNSGFYMGSHYDYYYYGEHFGRFTGFIEDAKKYKTKKIAENALKRLPLRICNTYRAEVFKAFSAIFLVLYFLASSIKPVNLPKCSP